jgi:hypothetical protein
VAGVSIVSYSGFKRNYAVAELFPGDFRVEKKALYSDEDDEMDDSPSETKQSEVDYTYIEMRHFPPMVNKNPNYEKCMCVAVMLLYLKSWSNSSREEDLML